MDWEIVWTEPASSDMKAIVDYIAQNNPAAAERIAADIVASVDLLRAVPFMGAVYPRGSNGRNRQIVCGKYRIFYRVEEVAHRVEVLTVWHGSRQEPELPP